eukprot:CAMPEP_0185454252 /NCGR_PEP_ID=MMETSP1365-20130426/72209_1 /TAXON_ID=38817 /ORGANISM="Gephyrocapsa oceanica, Strain RCC1303" /LENGTH=48 /DNA_ID= /DNA_START= /DNA_END= /DNA_ORIENTATION=
MSLTIPPFVIDQLESPTVSPSAPANTSSAARCGRTESPSDAPRATGSA